MFYLKGECGMFLKYVKRKNKTYVYLMEYLAVDKRCDKNYKDRIVVMNLGDLSDALLQVEIWKRHPEMIPTNIIINIEKEDLRKWINSILLQNHIYNF